MYSDKGGMLIIYSEEEEQLKLEADRTAISLEWAQYYIDYWVAYQAKLDEATTRQRLWDVVKFNIYAGKDNLANMQRNGTRMSDRDTDILLKFRAVDYPGKEATYCWNKKGQPKLRPLRNLLRMPDITKWERDNLFLMDS